MSCPDSPLTDFISSPQMVYKSTDIRVQNSSKPLYKHVQSDFLEISHDVG